jgi:hypothetical protein
VSEVDDPNDLAALAAYAGALADGIERAIPGWVERSVRRLLADQAIAVDDDLSRRIAAAGADARDDGAPRVRRLLATDVDRQAGNPLAILRDRCTHARCARRAPAGGPRRVHERSFPDDVHDLSRRPSPTSTCCRPGLGCRKAHVHLARRRNR